MISYISTPEGERPIDNKLTATQFGFIRQEMLPPTNAQAESIIKRWKSSYFYEILTGPSLDLKMVQKVVEAASRATRKNYYPDDLGIHPLPLQHPNYYPFLLTHAFEHLVVLDMDKRGVLSDTNGDTIARTAQIQLSFNGTTENIVAFCVNEVAATPEETEQSVKRILAEGRNLLRGRGFRLPRIPFISQFIPTSSTSNISVDPAGMSPTDWSP